MRIIAGALLASFCCACSGVPDEPVPLPEMPAQGAPVPLPDDPRREFDFWLGEWDVQNKHLRAGAWVDSGTARALIQPIVDGRAVLEQWNGTVGGDPLIGFSLRAHDPELGKWVIWLNWHGGRPGGFFPMHGTRREERIELFPPDDQTQMRYTFSRARDGSCQWDSARSKDGQVWTTDWVMRFTRREPPLPVDAASAVVKQPPAGASKFPRTRQLDFLIGSWSGEARRRLPDGSWQEGSARVAVSSMIEGFGLIQFLDTGWGEKTFAALGYDSQASGWVAIRADNSSGGLRRMTGRLDGRSADFTSASAPEMVRESWSDCAGPSCEWERAVSRDGGETWQTTLAVRFVRRAS